jgi:uncharacterized protein YndB with AHSA1/START domain
MTTTQKTFAATAPELFSVLVEPETYPEWLVGAKRIRSVSPAWPEPGSSFEHVVGFGPLAIPDHTRVLDVDPPRSLTMLVKVRPLLEAKVNFSIEPHPVGSLLTMTENPVGVFTAISPIAQPLIRARNERSMQRLVKVVARVHAAR